MHQKKKELSRSRTTQIFWVDAYARRKNRMEKQKMNIAIEVLNKVSAEFPNTKEFIEERLEQQDLKENISVEQVIYFSLISL